MLRLLYIFLLVLIVSCLTEAVEEPFFEKQILLKREAGTGAFAIPKMVITPSGATLIVAQNREGGDWGKRIDPIGLRSTDGGKTWSKPFLLIPKNFPSRKSSHMKPTGIVVDYRKNRIFTFVSRSPLRNRDGKPIYERWFYSNLQETRRLGRGWFLITSDDDGQNWSKPKEITQQLIKKPHWQEWSPVHTGIQINFGIYKGRLVVPVRCYCPEEDPSVHDLKYQHNGIIYSDDGGVSWIPAGRSESRVGECSIAERSDGSIYVNHRTSAASTRKTERMHNVSTDGGATFTTCTYSGISDARCHAGLTVLTKSSGRHLFLFTNVPGPKRTGLTISISEDEGQTWIAKRVIESGHSAYSDIVVLPDNTILCVYETGEQSSRQNLALARFNLAWVLSR